MNEIPEKIVIDGVRYKLLEENKNKFFRALVIPVGGGDPIWLSNKEVGEISSS